MAIYDKPVRLLMRDMVEDIGLTKSQILTKEQVVQWFAKNYPKIKQGTISAHLIRLSTNAPTRIHYKAKQADDLFFQLDGSHFRLYDVQSDPTPIYEPSDTDTEQRRYKMKKEKKNQFLSSHMKAI